MSKSARRICLVLLGSALTLQIAESFALQSTARGDLRRPCNLFATRQEKDDPGVKNAEADDSQDSSGLVHLEASARCPQLDRRKFLMENAFLAVLSTLTSRAGSSNAARILTETSSVSRGYSQQIQTYDPEIPFSSCRSYKKIKLPNELSVLLVSDRYAYRSSAALTVGGAGQFADPPDLPGLAHLMEHMILSYNSKSIFRMSRDFEDWLGDNEGASNAFTAYQKTCFHFSCPETVFAEALQRFAGLFLQQDVEKICREEGALRREVRRVDSELDFSDVNTQAFYLTKDFVNLEHPFSRFSAGNLESLETIPKQLGMDVGSRLIEFFNQHYLPSESVLVVIGRQDFYSLQRMVAPFATTLSRATTALKSKRPQVTSGAFLQGNRYKHIVLRRKSGDDKAEDMTIQWTLNLEYSEKAPVITATQVSFVLAQTVGRKGPGSLNQFLQRRNWVPSGPSGLLRISVPVEVSGFQIIKMSIKLTHEGMMNRSAVVAAVYDSFESLRQGDSFTVPRELLRQYSTIAKLHSYTLTPRPPDAVELAMDAQLFGFHSQVGTGRWYRFPEERNEISLLQRVVSETFAFMADPNTALIIATAGSQSLDAINQIGPVSIEKSSSIWLTEPVTGGRFFFDDMLRLPTKIEQLVLKRVVSRDELLPPVINPLVPPILRPPRIVQEVTSSRTNVNELLLFRTASEELNEDRVLRVTSGTSNSRDTEIPRWKILDPFFPGQTGLTIPRGPPESTIRCVFVFELLSPLPVRANVRQAAHAELWKVSFEAAVKDLVEYGGAPGGLAYEVSFNNFGMRVAVLGVSQTLPSYTRRLVRRLAEHSNELLQGPQYFPSVVTSSAITRAERSRWSSQRRKRAFISNLRRSTAYEAASEGTAFFQSCTGAVCFAQGDLLQREIVDLISDLQNILEPTVSFSDARSNSSAMPSIADLLYKPTWKPSFSCSIPGMSLLSDGCGRVPR